MSERQHHASCVGHIDCPKCGPESCARVVIVRDDGCPIVVICLTCMQRFNIEEEPDAPTA